MLQAVVPYRASPVLFSFLGEARAEGHSESGELSLFGSPRLRPYKLRPNSRSLSTVACNSCGLAGVEIAVLTIYATKCGSVGIKIGALSGAAQRVPIERKVERRLVASTHPGISFYDCGAVDYYQTPLLVNWRCPSSLNYCRDATRCVGSEVRCRREGGGGRAAPIATGQTLR